MDEKLISICGGLPPLIPSVDYKKSYKTRKWQWKQIQKHCNLHAWRRIDQPIESIEIPLHCSVIKYSDQEYEELLKNPKWTKEETDELFQLCAEFNLRFLIVHDRFSGDKTLEDLKQRYYQVNRLLLSKRGALKEMAGYTFDLVKENSRKQNLKDLLARNEEQLKEEQTLVYELLNYQQNRKKFENSRDALYKIISHNAEASNAVTEKSASLKRRKLLKKKEDESTRGVFLSSARLAQFKPSLQMKVTQILEEFGCTTLQPTMPTITIMDALEQLYSSIYSLIEVRKTVDKLQHELKVAKRSRDTIKDDISHGRIPSLKRSHSGNYHTPRESKRSRQ